jgi:flagellar motility protein MotE (MotC chaperone)
MDTEKSEMNGLERFLIWFLVPVVFAVVLLSVLFYMLDVDIKEPLQRLGNSIPIVRNWIPDKPIEPVASGKPETPAAGSKDGDKQPVSEADKTALVEKDKQIAELTAKLKESTDDAKQFQNSYLLKDQELVDLKAKMNKLEQDYQKLEQDDGSYEKSVSETSKIYAAMSPSKAAPILEKLTLSEQLLILSGMKLDNQTKILQKMSTEAAANVSILLKDEVPSRNREIKALQDRIKTLTETTQPAATPFTVSELSTSIAGMESKQAAELLLEMYKTNKNKVLTILKSADSSSRASILGAMTKADKAKAAAISSQLAP